jgi:intracellular sulfur oxidation DsrE/DsrF family protein
MAQQGKNRREMLVRLGAVAASGALGTRIMQAQGPSAPAPFTPVLHAEDAWMSAMTGKHRVVMDVTSPDGIPDAIRFVGNLFTGHKSGYGVDEADLAIAVVLRHGATPYGYADAIWSKYGKGMAPAITPPPTSNPFNSGSRMQLADLAKRGIQFMVCGTASRNLAGRLAGQGGDADAMLKEMAANLIPSARIVPAGVVGVTHAQERGFTLLYVG